MNKRLWGGLALALAATLCLAPNVAMADEAALIPIDEAHFPDPAFREYVENHCDENEDGQLSAEELAAVTYIDCENKKSDYLDEGKQLASLEGIEHFTSLTKLDCSDNQIEELDLSKNTELVNINCSVNKIKTLDLSKNTKLERLYTDSNALTSLNVSGIAMLKRLDCYNNELTDLDVSDSSAELELRCYQNKLTNLKLPATIRTLDCSENQLTELDASNNTAYLDLTCSQNRLTSLKLSATICGLDCSENQLTSLDLSNHDDLNSLICSSNKISQLNVSGCENLRELKCNDNRLAQLDLSGCERLSELNCSNNQLTSLDLTMCYKTITLDCSGNTYTIDVESGRTLDLSTLPGSFDTAKASGWSGGDVSGRILTVSDDAASVTYTYDCGCSQSATFTLNAGYAVSFDTGEGSKIDSQTVKTGEKAARPADPTWAGHAFVGWYADSARTQAYDFENTTVTGPTTIYAKWAEDTEAPVISGVKDGRTYCSAQKVTVTDEHPGTVTVNGATVELGEDGSFTLSPAAGEQKVVATDRAGNTATVTVTVNDGHTWGEGWSHDTTHHWRECSVCGEKGDVAAHAGGTATCSTKAVCETCGAEYGDANPSNHEHTETLAAKAATCTEDGLTEGSKCTDCGTVLTAQQTVPATGHKGGTATCSKKAVCQTCGEEYGKLDPKNHEPLEHVAAKAATAEVEGNTEYWRCTGCGKLFSDAAATEEIERADTVIPKLDPKKDEGGKTDGGNGGSGGQNENDGGNGSQNANGGGSDASNGNSGGAAGGASNGGTTTKTTVATVTTTGKAGTGLAKTGDPSAAAAGLTLTAGLIALGAALIRSKRRSA